MASDGSGQTRLTNTGGFGPVSFSPDGAKIAFSRFGTGAGAEIYTMAPDGSTQTQLTNNGAGDFAPAFSPDGTQLAFTSHRDLATGATSGLGEIYTMAADGSNQTNRTRCINLSDWDSDWQSLAQPLLPPPITPACATPPPPAQTPPPAASTPSAPASPLPDADGDGVPDASDGCPSTAGPSNNAGCPVNAFSLAGKAKSKKGFTLLSVTVPGPGVVKAAQATVTKKKPALMTAVRVSTSKAGKVTLKLKPNKAGKKLLARRGRFSVKARITYTPQGGKPKRTAARVKFIP